MSSNKTANRFSPRKRRCFFVLENSALFEKVFSAQAEVFPILDIGLKKMERFLRASGGVSIALLPIWMVIAFSPRKRRCFFLEPRPAVRSTVFSAQAEVFLNHEYAVTFAFRFLRASGGVSGRGGIFMTSLPFSPRKRRCFL